MKCISAIAFLATISLFTIQAHANDRKVKVEAKGNVGTMEIKVTTVDKKTVTDPQTETITITLAAADVMTTATKAAKIVADINMAAGNVTAAIDPGDPSVVIITSAAGRTVSRVDPRPLKTGEKDKLVAAVSPPETPNDAVVLGFDLDGSGSQPGTATIEIAGVPFTVSTSSGENVNSVLTALEALIDPDPTYDATIVGNELRIFGSVLGNDYLAFVTDAVGPGSLGYSYGFSLESFPQPIPEPATLALLALGLAGLSFGRRKRASMVVMMGLMAEGLRDLRLASW